MNRLDRAVPTALVCLLLFGWTLATFAQEPPDSEINPNTGYIESVSSTIVDSQYEVRHVIDPGQGAPTIQKMLTSSPADEVSPRISIGSGGEVAVVWWKDDTTDEVRVRGREPGTGAWSAATLVSEEGVDSRRPEIVYDGDDFWVVFEIEDSTGDTGVSVSGIRDDAEPFGQVYEIGLANTGGDVDSQIHFDSEELWVTWVDSSLEVGWSVYDYVNGSWDLPGYELIIDGDVPAARARIRTEVLGN